MARHNKDDGTRYTWQEIADRFGVENSTVSRIWSGKGLDITWPKKLVDDWLLANIIEPLRSGDTKVQIQKATLRKLEAEADMKELELRELSGELINVAEIEKLLSQYFHSIRQVLRSIPASSYVELFESIDAIELKTRLQEKIDESLEGIGMFKEVAIKWSAAPDMTPQTVLYRRPVAQFSNFQPKIVSSWLILA
ncbi:terminase small subunit, partial [Raoultella planticola]|uniref:terminase small subunit n=1 Tax=Raoultella planticola TaxID=575 RepID=UPI0010AE4A84